MSPWKQRGSRRDSEHEKDSKPLLARRRRGPSGKYEKKISVHEERCVWERTPGRRGAPQPRLLLGNTPAGEPSYTLLDFGPADTVRQSLCSFKLLSARHFFEEQCRTDVVSSDLMSPTFLGSFQTLFYLPPLWCTTISTMSSFSRASFLPPSMRALS